MATKYSVDAMRTVDLATRYALRVFLDRLPANISLERALLFGSRARGEARPDSDADLALVLREGGNDGETLSFLAGLAYFAYLETGVMIQPVPIALEDWLHPENFMRPGFLQNIREKGYLCE